MRRTNAERTAEMRMKIIEAAIDCLARYGYAATSTTLVLAKAKASRGAMLHHFPTKVDLMLAVARRAAEIYEERYVAEMRAVKDPRARFMVITEITWEALQQPAALALLEIMAGVENRARINAMVRLHLAAMRGLSIDRVLDPQDRITDDAFQLLKHYKTLLAAELIEGKK